LCDSRVSVYDDLFTGLQRFCGTTQRDDYCGTAGKLHGLCYAATWFHSDCDVDLHGRATPVDMHGIANVHTAGREERCDGYGDFVDDDASLGAAIGLAAICASDAYMGGIGCMFCRACGFAVVFHFEPRSSQTAWSRCGRRTLRTFAFQLRLRRQLRRPTGFPSALLDGAQPNERDWRVTFNGHSDTEWASSQRRRRRLAF
jgi:hypothetical protein